MKTLIVSLMITLATAAFPQPSTPVSPQVVMAPTPRTATPATQALASVPATESVDTTEAWAPDGLEVWFATRGQEFGPSSEGAR